MSDTKHTPGPWEWVESRFWGGYSGIVGPNNQEVLFPNTSNDGDTGAAFFDDFPSEADRQLIAAAPDLLLAIAWLVGLKDERPADYEEQKPLAWAAARSAFAKATGKPTTSNAGDSL